jgi:multiple sugar transport system ATP-binding protein
MNLFRGSIGEIAGEAAFIHPLFSWKLPAEPRGKLAAWRGKEIVFGLRPEDIGSADARRLADAPSLKAVIGVVERLGGQACLYLQTDLRTGLQAGEDSALAARPDDAVGCHAGQNVQLPLNAINGRFFDASSGAAIV